MNVIRACNVDEEGRFGGPERRIVQVAQAIQRLGVETTVVYPCLDSQTFERYLDEYDIRSIQLDITRLSLQKKTLARYMFRFVAEIMLFVRLFKQAKFDLVHVNGSYQFKVAIAAKLSKTPVIWHLNDTYAPGLLKSVFAIVAKRCASGFIVAGERVREYYLSETMMEHLPCEEVHAPVNLEIFNPACFKASVVEEKSRLRIGSVSGVNPAKGLEYFVQVAASVAEIYPDVEIVVAGAVLESQKKYYHMILEKMDALGLDRKRIRFVGLVDDIPAFLHQLDVCIFSSVTEASPTSIWEAMAMAKAIVTTDVGSVGQYIDHGVSGFIAPVGDVKQISSLVIRLIQDDGLRKSMGIAAREVAREHLSIESAAMRTDRIYRSILANVSNDKDSIPLTG